MSEDLEDYQDEMANKRRIYAQARAYLQRARSAGIPEKYQRIKQSDFANIIDPTFKDPEKFAESVYKNPQILFEKPFIVIDGGDMYSRKKAGFAILFRMITCDRRGRYCDVSQLAGEFQTIKFNREGNRNDLVRELKNEDILFLNEFHPRKFHKSEAFESNNFFDQLLEYRDDYRRPTIITFSLPLANGVKNRGNAIMDDRCGAYLAMLSQSDMKNNNNVFRVTVK